MTDSLDRLYQAVLAARDLDPATSRTARLFQHGSGKMAKKLAEEAVEVVIDAMHGQPEAVVRESADLLYNLVVLWVASGVDPKDVWKEMDRREQLFGIAEKLGGFHHVVEWNAVPESPYEAAAAGTARAATAGSSTSPPGAGRDADRGFIDKQSEYRRMQSGYSANRHAS